eukprot:130633_1
MTCLSLLLLLLCQQIPLFFTYLDKIEIEIINDLYNEWNSKYWTVCTWNMSMINDTNGNNYINNECGLYFDDDIDGNNSNLQHVINIQIDFPNNLSGSIPQTIGDLSYLQRFTIGYNDLLYGTIPNSICNLKHLTFLLISTSNTIGGSVPSCLFDIPHISQIGFDTVPNLSVTQNNIQRLCQNNNSDNFKLLRLVHIQYHGGIPDCFGYNLTNLENLEISDATDYYGIVPLSINNLKQLTTLHLFRLSIPDTKTFLNLKNMTKLNNIMLDLSLVYIDVTHLCQLTLRKLHIYYSGNNLIQIPIDCIVKNSHNKLYSFKLTGDGLTGTIDESICILNKTLIYFQLADTKHLSINIPQCISSMHHLKYVNISNNTHLYSLPKYAFNASKFRVLEMHHNKNLKGEISNLLTKQSFKYLQIFALHNNHFYDININNLLKNLFIYSKYLFVLTLHGNEYLSGILPYLNNDLLQLKLKFLQILTLHNLDIYGFIPHNIFLSNGVSEHDVKLITLHNNRLSGQIPHQLFNISSQQSAFYVIALPGNKFSIFDKNNNWWLVTNSLFITAESLYISFGD